MSISITSSDIQVNNLGVIYNNSRLALYNTNFTVKSGTITALVGPNGCGKSTLFKTIMGFLKPNQGQVTIGGCKVKEAQKNQIMAYVPQADEVDWNFPVSVFDVVMMGRYGYMNWLRIPSKCDRRIVMKSLARVGLTEFRHCQIGELSGGQKKRAFLARALAQKGKIILLDEPFTGVDITTEKKIIDLLIKLKTEGNTILISTHDLASISTFCDCTILLNQTVLAQGKTSEILTKENLTMTFGGFPSSTLNSV